MADTAPLDAATPPPPGAAIGHAFQAWESGDERATEQAARHAVAVAPEDSAGWRLIGRIHLARGDGAASLAAAREALARGPGAPDTLLLLGEIQIERAAWSDAIACLEQGLAGQQER